MVTHVRTPDRAHNELVSQVHEVLDRFAGMPRIEQIAMLGQVIGQIIAEVPTGGYGPAEIMHAVALNIAAGNEATARSISSAIQGAGVQ